jgi:hypothetical protein
MEIASFLGSFHHFFPSGTSVFSGEFSSLPSLWNERFLRKVFFIFRSVETTFSGGLHHLLLSAAYFVSGRVSSL